MSLKKILKGVLIGAAVFVTGGLALGAIGISAIAGTAITIKGAALFGAFYGGLQGASAAFIKKPKMSMDTVQARLNISIDPQSLGKWIFGQTAAATDIVYAEKIGETAACHVVAAAAHEIAEYGALYINDEPITLSSGAATGDWADVLTVARNMGTTTQSALTISGSTWPAAATGKGIAHYSLRWNFESDNGKQKLSGGIPTRITQVVKGAKVYDPRLDSSIGGSGSHRANDQATWEYTNAGKDIGANWALIVAHYLLGYRIDGKLIYGVGVDPADVDWTQVASMATICEQTVDSKPRYRIGGMFPITQDHENIIGQLESAIGGKVSKVGGKYFIWCPHNDLTPAGTMTDDDIILESGVAFKPAGPIEDLYNTAIGQYVEPDLLYQMTQYPEVIESTAVTEDGKRRLLEQNFSIIQDVEIAQRVAREMIRRTRFTGTITVVVGPRGLLIRPFDVINANFRETNFTNELFRVVGVQYSAQGAVALQLLEEDTSIYDTSVALGTALTQLDPNAYRPDLAYAVQGLTAANVSIPGENGTAIDAIRVTWTEPSSFVNFTEGGYRVSGAPDWEYARASLRDRATLAPVQPDTLYEFRVRHVSIEGVVGSYATTTIRSGNTTVIGPDQIADDAVTLAKFAEGIEPVRIVTTLPTSKLTEVVFLTTDSKLYRWNGTAYVASVPTVDLTGTVATAQIADAAVTAVKIGNAAVETAKLANDAVTSEKVIASAITEAKLAASAVTEGKISANAVVASKIAADAVTADKILANAVTAVKIAANAITSDKIIANAITSGKIETGAVTATAIAAGAVTTGKLDALAVTADKIAANAITAAKIATNAITADKIEANAIVAGKIAAAAVSADALAADSVSVVKIISNTSKTYGTGNTFQFEFGTTTEVAGYQGAGILRTSATNGFGVGGIAANQTSFAIAGQQAGNYSTAYGAAFANSHLPGSLSHRTISLLANNIRAGFFQDYDTTDVNPTLWTPINNAQLCNGTYSIQTNGDVYVDGDITATGTITPFTGSHDGLIANIEAPEPGDIMLDVEIVARKGISDTLALMTTSSTENQPAIGVFNSECPASYIPSSIAKIIPAPETAPGVPETETIVDPDLAYVLVDRKVITVNSVGEGQINVCGEGGNIQAGDLIVTSSNPGKGMRQDDDIIRGKTVAKARESATFEDESDIKQIACIYLCG
jgi:hypothetical protein